MPQDFGVHGKFFPLRISLFQLVEGLLQLYNLVMFRAKREITLIARERETHGELFLRTPVAALLPARVLQERYENAGMSANALLWFGGILCVSIAVLPWMLRHEALWVKRDAVLMLDVGTDVFYIFICTFRCS